MFTQYDFYKGMFCELGGEFVDTDHEDLQKLAKEVGVEMQNLTTDGGDDLLGAKPGLTDAKSALDAFRADLPKMSQKMADSLDPNAVTSWFWAVYPFTLGSYASAKVGQYTHTAEVASEPALNGRLQFAGEHTSSEFLGFMNGDVQSGNRAAEAFMIMALHK